MLRLVSDERRARAVADLIFESLEPAEAASTAFETDDPWPGGGRAWLMEAYFGSEPDEEAIRTLIAAAADETTARGATFGMTEKRDWVANSLAGLKPVRAGRFLVHGRHDRSRVQSNDVAIEIEAGLAFGTGHHGTTRGCLMHFDRLLAPTPEARLDVGCGAAVRTCRQFTCKVWLATLILWRLNANARLNGVGAFCRRSSREASRTPLCARPPRTTWCSPISWRNPCGCSRPRSRRSSARTATPSSPACFLLMFLAC
jgi:ribosomal protein L11 methyltransferase